MCLIDTEEGGRKVSPGPIEEGGAFQVPGKIQRGWNAMDIGKQGDEAHLAQRGCLDDAELCKNELCTSRKRSIQRSRMDKGRYIAT